MRLVAHLEKKDIEEAIEDYLEKRGLSPVKFKWPMNYDIELPVDVEQIDANTPPKDGPYR